MALGTSSPLGLEFWLRSQKMEGKACSPLANTNGERLKLTPRAMCSYSVNDQLSAGHLGQGKGEGI